MIFARAARSLKRAPSFTLTVVATLALGIGLATAVFTVANALLFRKLPVRDQHSLVTLWGETRDGAVSNYPLSLADTRRFARETRTLSSVAYVAYEGAWPVSVIAGRDLARFRRALVSGNYFDVLGARMVIGRALRPSDDVVGAAPVAVMSHAAWVGRFGADSAIVGRRLQLQEFPITYTIVGVAPRGLEFPNGVDFWAPFVPARLTSETDSTAYTALDLVARLAPNATSNAARAELDAYFARPDADAASHNLRGVAQPFDRQLLGNVRIAALVFVAAAMVLLLITCINVATLLLVRGLARAREIALRQALGATKARIVAQLVGENVLLASAGGVFGVGVAAIAVRWFVALAPITIPLVDTIHLDAGAVIGAIGITAAALLMFGVAPALAAARGDLQAALRSGAGQTGGRPWRFAREALVSVQVALAVLVLSAGALLARTLAKLERADLAFDASHLLVAELAFRFDQYSTVTQQINLMRQLTRAVSAAPGIVAASPVVAVPYSGTGGWTGSAGIDDETPEQGARNPHFNMELVSPSYFQALGLHAVRGRAFTDADGPGAERVVVVNEAMARQYWPKRDPIGERLRMQGGQDDPLTVIGVVPDTRYRELRDAPASVYFPLAQSFFPFAPTTLVVRASGDASGIVPAVRQAIAESAPGVALANAAPFESYLAGPLAQPKVDAFLLALFAAAAAALAAVGLFGVMAAMVRQRTRELGVRMALGATTREVQAMIVRRGLTLAAIGGGAGIAGSMVTNRALASLLYGVRPADLTTLISACSCVIAMAVVASIAPAWWTGRIAPAIALRAEQ